MRKTMYFVSLLVAFSILLAGCASPTTVPTQPVPTLMPTPVPTLGVGSTLIRAAMDGNGLRAGRIVHHGRR